MLNLYIFHNYATYNVAYNSFAWWRNTCYSYNCINVLILNVKASFRYIWSFIIQFPPVSSRPAPMAICEVEKWPLQLTYHLGAVRSRNDDDQRGYDWYTGQRRAQSGFLKYRKLSVWRMRRRKCICIRVCICVRRGRRHFVCVSAKCRGRIFLYVRRKRTFCM